MAREENFSAALDIAYLAACAVNGETPDAARVSEMDLPLLYSIAEHHLLTGITAMALERAGVADAAFTQAKGKAVRRAAAFDLERAAVQNALEKAGIWYMPLKGSVLKDLYPRLGMRQMSDCDLLIDAARADDANAVMKGLGFSVKPAAAGIHDVYLKAPFYNFELHRALFRAVHGECLQAYYADVKTRLLPDAGTRFGFHFRDEDFYVFMIAHEYKHYASGGAGLRSLLDTYVYCTKKGDALDRSYLAGELEKLGLADFEARNRSLALHLFGGEPLTGAERDMLAYMVSSGAHGTVDNRVKNRLAAYGGGLPGKLRYVFDRVFPPMDTVRVYYPLFAKWPVLLPLLPFYRLLRGLTVHRQKLWAELRALSERGPSRR